MGKSFFRCRGATWGARRSQSAVRKCRGATWGARRSQSAGRKCRGARVGRPLFAVRRL